MKIQKINGLYLGFAIEFWILNIGLIFQYLITDVAHPLLNLVSVFMAVLFTKLSFEEVTK